MKKKLTHPQIETDDILGTNSAHDGVLFDEKPAITPEERKKILSFAVTIGVSLLVVVGVLVIGIVFGNITRKKTAAQEPRESTPTFYQELATEGWQPDKITSAITEAYYTLENGLMVTITFGNALDTDEHISKVVVAIYTENDVQIAKAQSESMKADFVVEAGGTNKITMYIKPEFVSIADDPLETLQYEITVDHETRM